MPVWITLAQVPSPSPDLLDRYGNLGATAVLGLALLGLLYYGINKVLPSHREHVEKLVNDHNAAISKLTSGHNETVQSLKDEYLKVIKEVRDECKEERREFLIELRTERALRQELEERRFERDKEIHDDHLAMAAAINRLTEVIVNSTQQHK